MDNTEEGETMWVINDLLDIVIDHSATIGNGKLNNTLAATFRDVEVVDVAAGPEVDLVDARLLEHALRRQGWPPSIFAETVTDRS